MAKMSKTTHLFHPTRLFGTLIVIKFHSVISVQFFFFRLLIDEVDEVTIAVHNLSDHPSLYSTNDLGSEDPLTKLRPRVRKCLEFITDEHYTNDFQALRRYCRQVIEGFHLKKLV